MTRPGLARPAKGLGVLSDSTYGCYGGTGRPGPRDRLAGVPLGLRVPSGLESRGLTTTRSKTPAHHAGEAEGPPLEVLDGPFWGPQPRLRCAGPSPPFPYLASVALRPAVGVTHPGPPAASRDSADTDPRRWPRSENLAEHYQTRALKPPRLRPDRARPRTVIG